MQDQNKIKFRYPDVLHNNEILTKFMQTWLKGSWWKSSLKLVEGTHVMFCVICRDLSFVQFKKREKHPWRTVTFSKVWGF